MTFHKIIEDPDYNEDGILEDYNEEDRAGSIWSNPNWLQDTYSDLGSDEPL